ncbi:MAG: hypothetical protein ABL894_09020 [Hyphomicrobium sp.]
MSFEKRPTPVRLIAIAALAFAGIWLVVTRGLTEYLATTSPEIALRLDPSNPSAMLALARKSIGTRLEPRSGASANDQAQNVDSSTAETGQIEPDSEETSRIVVLQELAIETAKAGKEPVLATPLDPATRDALKALARGVLQRDPLNARAIRILGEISEAEGNAVQADTLMRTAVRFSLRESAALAWLIDKSFERNDYTAAMSFSDSLMRTRPQTRKAVIARLSLAAETRAGNSALKALLATNPPWRANFFALVAQNVTDARTPLDLLLSLQGTDTPPTSADLKNYLDFLVGKKLYGVAYSAWLQFLPPEQLSSAGFVVNGDFERSPSGLPFDWVIKPGAGVTVAVEQHPDRLSEHGLQITLGPGRVTFHPMVQLTTLPPGEYIFSARYKGLLNGRRGLLWRIACALKPSAPLAQSASALGKTPAWTPLAFSIIIPQSGCEAQHLKLELDARSASEQLVSGAVWYDDVVIRRKDATPGAG